MKRIIFLACILYALVFLIATRLLAQVPQTLNYQGILTDATGEAVSDGSYEIVFNIYDQASSGNDLWSEHQTVAVQDGVFSVILGVANPIDIEFDRPLWLAMRVNGGTELSPRIELTGSAYSFQALSVADGAVTNPKLSDGAVTENKLAEKAVTNSKLDTASVTSEKIATGAVVKSVNGLKDHIELEAGDNVSINKNGGKLTISAVGGNGDGGDITAITAGEGLSGGGAAGEVSLSIKNKGISANKIADGQVVKSLNGLTDDVELEAGDNVTLTTDGTRLTISAMAGGMSAPLELTGTEDSTAIISATNHGSKASVYGTNTKYGTTGTLATSVGARGERYGSIGKFSGTLAARDYGALGVFSDDGGLSTYGTLGGQEHGASGYHEATRNEGYLGSELCGAYGEYAGNGNYGVLGADVVGAYGRHQATKNRGYVGTNKHGVYGVHNSSGNTGYLGGETYGALGIHQSSKAKGYLGAANSGVHGWNENGNAGSLATSQSAVFGHVVDQNKYAGTFNGKVQVIGHLSKSSGSFKIDHPLDPANQYLYHSFVESPDMKNIYDGVVQLDANGEAWVQMPEWFDALNQDFRYQLTALGGPAPSLHIAEKIFGNRFKIAGGENGMEVSWQVTGIRHDPYAEAHRIPVEEMKPDNERGQYLHPVEHGAPASLGVGFEERQKMQAEMKTLSEE
jgi:hypothetical protein